MQGLNPAQAEAVQHKGRSLLVVAGPGSGKTKVITHRVAWLIKEQNVAPHRILAVTFTRKAAEEMRRRCFLLVGSRFYGLQVSTFHSFCATLLRRWYDFAGLEESFTIYDRDDQLRTVKQAIEALGYEPAYFNRGDALAVISDLKNRAIAPAQYKTDGYRRKEAFANIYKKYERFLKDANAVDFDDLLLKTAKVLGKEEVRDHYQSNIDHLLVDEFQDTNPLQMRICRGLVGETGKIFTVGDPDQSIYSWRHADISNLLDFRDKYPDTKTVNLDRSYRCSSAILEAANSLIKHNKQRFERELSTVNKGGEKPRLWITYDEEEEARRIAVEIKSLTNKGTPLSQIAVTYRTNAQSRIFEAIFREKGIAYVLVGGVGFFERREIKDIICYLRLAFNPNDNAALERIVNTPRRNIGAQTLAKVARLAAERDTTPLNALRYVANDSQHSVVNKSKATSIGAFLKLLDALNKAVDEENVESVINLVLKDGGYLDHIRGDKETYVERLENIEELKSLASKHADAKDKRAELGNFLQDTALETEATVAQGRGQEPEDTVTLITMHRAKGLEYDAFFITGLEQGLCPHSRSMDSIDDLEEERRLLYVAITRARRDLYVTYCRQRRRQPTMASAFLKEAGLKKISHGEKREYRASTGKPGALAIGSRVNHPVHGSGLVLEVTGSGRDAIFTVIFMKAGVRRLGKEDGLVSAD